ncbi:MAG: hypothetical protein KGN16_00495 [Burkholderiales bacterium]|nr:hypothetical protein [Burkholderiales bacterium]
MIGARWALLLAALALAAGASGAFGSAGAAPAAQRLTVTAACALLAPLAWPGRGATLRTTVGRIAGWSLAAAAAAAIVLRAMAATGAMGAAGQPASRIAAACAMLALVVATTHAALALLETLCRETEAAARGAVIALALLGALPLWLGPAAELASGRRPWIVGAVAAASPLSHLALACGDDWLHNAWFYQHANLAGLQVPPPDPGAVAAGYAMALAALLAALAWAFSGAARRLATPRPS